MKKVRSAQFLLFGLVTASSNHPGVIDPKDSMTSSMVRLFFLGLKAKTPFKMSSGLNSKAAVNISLEVKHLNVSCD
jgi:hypothetical protein